jgi:hypothetical protein
MFTALNSLYRIKLLNLKYVYLKFKYSIEDISSENVIKSKCMGPKFGNATIQLIPFSFPVSYPKVRSGIHSSHMHSLHLCILNARAEI